MDIKTLLLKSLSSKTPIHGSRRIHCGKSCIIIKYVIHGNIFSIKTTKISRRHETWIQRIKCYKKNLRTYRSRKTDSNARNTNLSNTTILCRKNYDKETLAEYVKKHSTKEVQTDKLFKNSSLSKHMKTQTIVVQRLAKEMQTEPLKTPPKLKEIFKLGSTTKSKQPVANQPVSLTTTAQQTIASARFSRSLSFNKNIFVSSTATSTISNVECKAVQCKRSTQTAATNTDNNTRDSFAQVECDLPTNPTSLPKELKMQIPLPAEELRIFIYMLNEIGESVINQNQTLKSNTDMIKYIIQTNMLQNSQRLNSSSYRSTSTQTDPLTIIETKNNSCQTNSEHLKQRKLLLFKGRNSLHKKSY